MCLDAVHFDGICYAYKEAHDDKEIGFKAVSVRLARTSEAWLKALAYYEADGAYPTFRYEGRQDGITFAIALLVQQ